jgi:hypothetical protein
MKRRSVWVVEVYDNNFGWLFCSNGEGLAGYTDKRLANKSLRTMLKRFPGGVISNWRVVRCDASK